MRRMSSHWANIIFGFMLKFLFLDYLVPVLVYNPEVLSTLGAALRKSAVWEDVIDRRVRGMNIELKIHSNRYTVGFPEMQGTKHVMAQLKGPCAV